MTTVRALATAVAISLSSLAAHAQVASPVVASQVGPVQSMTTSDGVMLRFPSSGNGPACLFLHGGPGSGSEVIERLAGQELEQHFRMVYLDQRGSGRSGSDPKGNYSLERVIQDLEEVRERLGIKQWVVMSHSFGGIIAAAYARAHPDRISGLILVNSILNLPASMESTATQ
jgi:proline iminopeptidase